MKKTLSEIAAIVGGTVEGDGDIMIDRLAGIREAGPGALSFIANEKYLHFVPTTRASALVVSRNLSIEGIPLVRVDDPDRAWSELLELVKPAPVIPPKGIDPSAFVGDGVTLDPERVTVMAHAAVMDGATVGPGTVIYPCVYVGHGARIGEDCLLYPGVVIRERVEVGNRVVIQPGAVIGSDGFGYHETKGGLVKQEQFGTVVLEDDVEIGANVTIDRARFYETRIGKGTKIDNLVQIAHNVAVGRNTVIVSQAGISGSTRVGNGVKIAGQVGIVGHLTIGDGAVVAAKSGVSKDIPPGKIYFGIPAGEKQDTQRQVVALRKLPGLLKTIRRLEERIVRLEAQSKDD